MNPEQNQGQPQSTATQTPPAATTPPAANTPATPTTPSALPTDQPAAPAKSGGNKMLLIGAGALVLLAVVVYFLT